MPSLQNCKALRAIGFDKRKRRLFFEGKSMDFYQKTTNGKTITCMIRCTNNELRCGIIHIHEDGGRGELEFSRFRRFSIDLAREFGLNQVAVIAMALVNKRLEQILIRRGMTPGVELVPDEFGNEMEDVLSKVYEVRR